MRMILAVLLVLPLVVSADDSTFAPMDVFNLEYASDPRVAPDGRSVVYERLSFDVMTDRRRSNIWQVDIDGRNHRPLLSAADSYRAPRWSNAGDRIAYLTTREKSTELRVRWLATGHDALITSTEKPISSVTWSPGDDWLAFTMAVKRESDKLVKPRSKPKGAEWSEAPVVIDTVRYQFDGRGIVEPEYRHVFVVPADGGSPRQLTDGWFNHEGPLAWAPDGSRILFSANRHEDWERQTVEADIFSVDVDSGELRAITGDPGSETSPRYSPDGKKIVYLQMNNEPVTYRHRRIGVMNADGGGSRLLTEALDISASNPIWAENSRSVYYQFDERGVRKVGRVSLGGRNEVIVSGLGGTAIGRPYLGGSYDVANDVVVYTRGTPHRPADLATRDGVITALNEDALAHKQLGDVHEVVYSSSHDGQEIHGWYVTPPDFEPGRKYPLILEIHGGPNSAYGAEFSAEIQLMAAQGYVVFYNNYRGSTSYGKDFALLLQYKYASPDDFADHISGVDFMIGRGMVDERNLFVTGGSAGGIGTAYAIGLTNRFNAAVAAKPVVNWVSKTLTADSMVYQIRHQFPGYPWDHPDHYWQRSPLSLVGNVKTPTLLITGEEDRRTPISETEQYYQALKLRGIDAMMVRLPDSPHGIASRPSRLITKVDYILAWFDKFRVIP